MTLLRALRRRAARAWRWYTRMRIAIVLLIGVALVVLVGSFVPQQDTSAQAKVDQFLLEHHNLEQLAEHAGFPLTQVFVSPLFYALLVLLYVALGACILRRARALVMRTVRGHPRSPQYWGEWGSWMFHASFFLLLVAVLYGKSTGFEGIMTINEGQTVSEAKGDFDTLQQGLLFDGHHAGFQVRLNSFRATYQPNGQPADFVSNVTVLDGGRKVETRDIRVNDFLAYRDVDFYQQDYGWAPEMLVRNPQGRVVYDAPVQFFGADKSQQTGVLKVPDFGFTIPGAGKPVQVGARLTFYPDARTVAQVNPDGSISPSSAAGPGGEEARNPVVVMHLYVGDLGLDQGRPQDVNVLDTSAMQPYLAGDQPLSLGPGDNVTLPLAGSGDCSAPQSSCFTVQFVRLRQYSLFHVKRDQGVPLVYLSFGLIMTGLLTKLYLRPLLEARERRRRRAVRAPGYAWLASAAVSESETGEPASSGGR